MRILRGLVPVASLAAFVATAASLDPALVRARRYPRALRDDDRAAVVATLATFQKTYQDFFASGGDPAMLDACPATPGVKHRIFRDLGYLADARLVLVQDLAAASTVEAVLTAADTAELLVNEDWNYVFQSAADRNPTSQPKGMSQGFRYALARGPDGVWVITSWRPEELPASQPEFKW